ncbi:MAG: sigma 54-interacting transcriptional regulator [Nannocystaceae bacterium]
MEITTRRLPTSWRRPGRITLRVCEGPDQGTEVVLDGDCAQRLHGGRAPVNNLVLNDEHVSGSHFELSLHPRDGVLLRDLGSTNGVLMDNTRLVEAWLGPGAVFKVGNSAIQLVSTDPVAVPISAETSFGGVFGQSLVMRELFANLEKASRMDPRLSVLLTGDTGTGKELVARALHDASHRKGAFVAVNCAAISPQLAESYLFGHRKGSFSGATEDRPGCFEEANGGTLFLDEIGELPLDLQPKLLRTLQEGELCRIGEHRPKKVDVRVISATHRDLRWMVTQNKFRDDLFYRLARVPISLPALRDRPEDIAPLADRFLVQLADNGGPARGLALDARKAILAHPWPGNIRELRNVIETAYFMADGPSIRAADLRLEPWGPVEETVGVRAQVFDLPLKEAREEFERLYMRRLIASPGTLASKAKRAGITDEGLRQARKRLGE